MSGKRAATRLIKASSEPEWASWAASAAAQRGQAIFQGAKAGCSVCHAGPYFTDGLVHDVGLGRPADKHQGFNTPSLVGCGQKIGLLHDGRADSLEEALRGDHAPEKVAGEGPLTEAELADLIAYLMSL